MTDKDQSTLGGTFGSKTKGSQIGYGHPFGDAIRESALNIIKQAATGILLIKACQGGQIPIHVIKGNGLAGFSPQARVVYLQVPGKQETASSVDILMLTKAMREADQELIGLSTPDPMKDLMNYAAVMHTKNLDSIIYTCKLVKELTNSSNYKELLDGMARLGYGKVYSAYLENVSKEHLFKVYADS